MELEQVVSVMHNQIVSNQEQVVWKVLSMEYRTSKRGGYGGIMDMDNEIRRQLQIAASVGSATRTISETCKNAPSAQARFDELKKETRRIQTWLTERKDHLYDEYGIEGRNDSYSKAFYDQLLYYADILEEKYSPSARQIREVGDYTGIHSQWKMEDENSQIHHTNNNEVLEIDPDENKNESRRIYLLENSRLEDPTASTNPILNYSHDYSYQKAKRSKFGEQDD